jgi:hypothetical protein
MRKTTSILFPLLPSFMLLACSPAMDSHPQPKTGQNQLPITATNGLEVNGLQLNGVGTNGLQLNGFALNGLQLNGLVYNGLQLNGLQLNGLQLNGLQLNGLQLNGLQLNGLQLNGVGTNGLQLNGLQLNGLQLNGVAWNGLQLNGLQLNGLQLNGLQLNGLLYNAQSPDVTTWQNLNIIMAHLVACALPASDSVTMYGPDGAHTYSGQRGYAPEWKTGPLSQTGNEAVRACVASTSYAGLTSVQGYIPILNGGQMQANVKKLLKYLVQCALPPSESVTVGPDTIQGVFGLAPEWYSGPASDLGQRGVSACLAARTNPLAKTVQISIRGLGIPITSLEKAQFGRHEGAFWGNLFSATPYVKSCQVSGGGISGRVCTKPGTCGFQDQGSCALACPSKDGDGNFYGCGGEPEVINTYLAFSADVSFGIQHTCLKRTDGRVSCWGDDTYGQMGNGTVFSGVQASPVPVITSNTSYLTNVDELAIGGYCSCARRTDGVVFCWGQNLYGQVGNGSFSASVSMAQGVFSDAAQIVGGSTPCAVRTDGSLFCWGLNSSGELGNGSTVGDSASPVAVAVSSNVVQVSSGAADISHHCAVLDDGTMMCWGPNDSGQIGDGSTTQRSTPVSVMANSTTKLAGVTQICEGGYHTCALRQDGTIWCWGSDQYGQIGVPTAIRNPYPVGPVALPHAATQVGCGGNHTCALLDNRDVWCWGENGSGALGNGSTVQAWAPVGPVFSGGARLELGFTHTCVRKTDGTTWCWGDNGYGQLGDGSGVSCRSTPGLMTWSPCGDGVCDASIGENCATCAADCATPEVCDGIDNDCDGVIDNGLSQTAFYRDADGDGYGNPAFVQLACAAPPGYVANNTDCNDADPTQHPNATFYRDADGDGYGNAAMTTVACSTPTGYVTNSTDCNDANATVHPGATEVCNGIDDNCNGQIDEGVTLTFYRDADGDGYGNAASTTQACSAPAGYVSDATDCNDANSAVHPGATEICNGIDDNCNGLIDEGVQPTFYRDADGDGYGTSATTTLACTAPAGYVSNATDCNDANSAVHPGATEVANGVDDNCNGFVDETGAGLYQENSPWVAFSGTWALLSSPKANGGAYEEAQVAGATATIAFSGSSLTWYTRKGSNCGIAQVVIDGGAPQSFDLYAKSTTWNTPIAFPVAAGMHTAQIRVTGTKNASSSGTYVDVDALQVQ